MTVLLIRHGETPLNVARVLQPADTPLSQRGVLQAEALAQRLAALRPVAILSSDLPRAWQTAECIAAVTGASIEVSALLRERNFGDWRGQPYDTLDVDPLTWRDAPPGGESTAEFEARVALAFAHIVQRSARAGGTLAVVTHGLVIRAMLTAHVQLPASMSAPTHMGNTGLSVFEVRSPHFATLVNCTRHLEQAMRDDAQALSGG